MRLQNLVYFKEDKLPYKIMARNERFLVCSRKLNRRQDSVLLWQYVDIGDYFSFTEAFNKLKDYPVYTIVDLEEKIRGRDNYVFSDIDYSNKESCEILIQRLSKGECEISHRNRTPLYFNNNPGNK